MPLQRIAIIADVHGNLTALEAVLADIAARGIDRIINLGDLAGKGPRGAEAYDLSERVCELTIRGNWEEILPGVDDSGAPEMRWWRDQLRPDQLERMPGLPLSHDLLISGRNVRLFHASAHDLHSKVFFTHTPEQFSAMFENTELTGDGPVPVVVGYGDVHNAYVKTDFYTGQTLFNPGSVGNPLDQPVPSYAILEGALDEADDAPFGIQIVRVPYDVEAELAAARAVDMPALRQYEIELRDAIYRGYQE